nr:RHS repeat-associated core domain-containing protein [Myroides marinus]
MVTYYLGTPEYMYNAKGELVWHATLDIYGRITVKKGDKYDCPFRYQGQYADRETGGLYYNRFRFYDSNTGLYFSQDPIGLIGGMVLYWYVGYVNG